MARYRSDSGWSNIRKPQRLPVKRNLAQRRSGTLVGSLMEVEGMEPDRDQRDLATDLYRGPDSEEYDYPDELDGDC